MDDNELVPRSIRLSDFFVVFSGFLHNIAASVSTFTEELMEISIYHANRETKVAKATAAFSQELEKLQEE